MNNYYRGDITKMDINAQLAVLKEYRKIRRVIEKISDLKGEELSQKPILDIERIRKNARKSLISKTSYGRY